MEFEPFKPGLMPGRGEGIARSPCWPLQQLRFLGAMKSWLILMWRNQMVVWGKEGFSVSRSLKKQPQTQHLDVFLSVCCLAGLGCISKTTSGGAGLYKSLIVRVVSNKAVGVEQVPCSA